MSKIKSKVFENINYSLVKTPLYVVILNLFTDTFITSTSRVVCWKVTKCFDLISF